MFWRRSAALLTYREFVHTLRIAPGACSMKRRIWPEAS